MGILMGALAGAAGAYDKIAEENRKQWTAERLMEIQKQNEIDKEGRINELQKASEGRQETRAIAAEGRGIVNAKTTAQNALDIENSNAPTALKNKQLEQSGLLEGEVNKARQLGDIQKANAIEVANATYHAPADHTDYEGRKVENEFNREKLKQLQESGKIPFAVKSIVESNSKTIGNNIDLMKAAQVAGTLTPEVEREFSKKNDLLANQSRELLSSHLSPEELDIFTRTSKPTLSKAEIETAALINGTYKKEAPAKEADVKADNKPPQEGIFSRSAKALSNALAPEAGSMRPPSQKESPNQKVDDMIKAIQNNPRLSAEQKKEQIDFIRRNN